MQNSSPNEHDNTPLKSYQERVQEYHQTIEDTSKALLQNPNDIVSYTKRAEAYLKLRQYKEALANFDLVLALDPQNAQALTGRGKVYCALHDYERASIEFEEALKFNPHYAPTYVGRGKIFIYQRLYEQALEQYDKAAIEDPNLADAYAGRGFCKHILGNNQEALQDAELAIKLDPYVLDSYSALSLIKTAQKDYEQALIYANIALELDPLYADGYNNRGIVYLELKQYKEALDDFNYVIELDPSSNHAYTWQGKAYAALHQQKKAKESFKSARKAGAIAKLGFTRPFTNVKKTNLWLIPILLLVQIGFNQILNDKYTDISKFLQPITDGTDWIINPTTVWGILNLLVIFGIIFGVGKLRPADLGLKWKLLPTAIVTAVILWIFLNILTYTNLTTNHNQIQFNPDWTRYKVAWYPGEFLATIVALAFVDQIIFQGFILPQLTLRLKGQYRILSAICLTTTLYIIMRLPFILGTGTSNGALSALTQVLPNGVLFACVYLFTGNIFTVIGFETLYNTPALIINSCSCNGNIISPQDILQIEVLSLVVLSMYSRKQGMGLQVTFYRNLNKNQLVEPFTNLNAILNCFKILFLLWGFILVPTTLLQIILNLPDTNSANLIFCAIALALLFGWDLYQKFKDSDEPETKTS